MWFTRISIKYPVFTIMMMLCFLVLGLASWQRMHIEEFPDVDFPFVVVHTTYLVSSVMRLMIQSLSATTHRLAR